MLRYLFITLALLAVPSLTADILAVLPFPGYSHVMPFMPILKELGKRGHSVTLITSLVDKSNPPGLTQINANVTSNDMREMIIKKMGSAMSVNVMRFARGPMFQLAGLIPMCAMLSRFLLERTKPFLPPPGTKFDLVFVEPFFCMEPLVAVSSLYNASIVATLPMPLSPAVATTIGNPHGFSYVPNTRLPFTGEMNFLQRVWNTIVNVVELLLNNLLHLPRQDKLMREILGYPNLPYIGDILQNISLLLTETHFSLNYPRPYLKNVVEVGGISLQIAEPLPKDLENFMNEAKHGIIYFSWGSHFEADDADKLLEAMMKDLSKLKQTVLFKWHTKIPNTPANVRVQKWFPQPSILAHNKTLLFISHGGLNSIYEAAYYGVPVLGTPMFGDQPYNIRLLESIGMAVSVDPEVLDDGVSFSSALQKILNDPSYRENGKKESLKLQDRPLDVVREAVYWIEYILKHGASHLQPATKNLPWYSVALLDVSLFLLALLTLVILLFYYLFAICIRLCRRKSSKPTSQKKKKQ